MTVKTEQRPVSLPPRANAPQQGGVRLPFRTPGGADDEQSLPAGAVRWTTQPCYDRDGAHVIPKGRVAVDKRGVVVPHEEPAAPKPPVLPWQQIRWRMRHAVRPWYVAGGVVGMGALADGYNTPAWEVAAGAVVVVAAAYRVAPRYLIRGNLAAGARADIEAREGKPRRPRLSDLADSAAALIRRRRRFTAYITATAGAWLTAADMTGLDPHTTGGWVSWALLAALFPVAARPYWAYSRPSGDDPMPEPEKVVAGLVAVEVGNEERVWKTRVGNANGALPGTQLVDVKPVKGGWAGTIASNTPGSIDPDRFRTAVGRIAAAYEMAVQDVVVEPSAANASQAVLRIQPDNPLCEVQMWPGPAETWDWERGLSRIGRFGDDVPATYRWWNSGGPWHDLISGATGAGKSEFVNMLILSELHSDGLALSRVCDPQMGQSFGDLQDHVDWFAPTIAEMRLLLLDTVKEMLRRNRLYSKRRQKTWQPTRELPLIVVTIDEAHVVLADPICFALVEKLAKMARKCGIKLRIITQVPVVTEIGNSTPIKDALLAGQVIVFRTGSPIGAQVAFNGNLPVDPHKLLPEWPEGSRAAGQTTAGLAYMIGTSRRAAPLRTFYTGESLAPWLVNDHGNLTITPGVPGQEMVDESGPLWGNRKARIEAALNAPIDPNDILPGGLVEALVAQAGGAVKPAAKMSAPSLDVQDGDAKDIVLRTAVAEAGADGRILRRDIGPKCVNPKTGKAYSARALTDALGKLVDELLLVRMNGDGLFEVTAAGRAKVSADQDEAREMVDELVGAEVVDA